MQEKLADEEVQLTEKEIIEQVLGTRPGYARGMGKFVIPTPSSSRSYHATEVNSELETCKQELAETKQHLTETKEQMAEAKGTNSTDGRIATPTIGHTKRNTAPVGGKPKRNTVPDGGKPKRKSRNTTPVGGKSKGNTTSYRASNG
uniref:Uncharacterized protein n=1 Tax=Fagus sylvatica TaxID=28930 RepID=A0A2N9H6H5_FAGSY